MSILTRYDGRHVRERALSVGPVFIRVGRYSGRYSAAIEIGRWPRTTLLFKVSGPPRRRPSLPLVRR